MNNCTCSMEFYQQKEVDEDQFNPLPDGTWECRDCGTVWEEVEPIEWEELSYAVFQY